MRWAAFIFAVGLLTNTLSLPAHASGDDSPAAPPISCRNGLPGGVNCIVSKQDHKEARNAFARGLKLQESKQLEEAFTQFDEASRLVPQNQQFLTARELVKAQLVFNHVERGNALLLENSRMPAAAEFRAAIELDPGNRVRAGAARRSHPRTRAQSAQGLTCPLGRHRRNPPRAQE